MADAGGEKRRRMMVMNNGSAAVAAGSMLDEIVDERKPGDDTHDFYNFERRLALGGDRGQGGMSSWPMIVQTRWHIQS